MKKLLILTLIVTLTLAIGCNKKETAEKPAPSAPPAKTSLSLGVIPQQNTGGMKDTFNSLADYLSDQLQLKVDIREYPDYPALVNGMGKGQIDLAYFGPFTYLVAHELSGAEALVAGLVDNDPYYKSLIITRKDSGIKTLANLKGKKFAFSDPASVSGHIIPAYLLSNDSLRDSISYVYVKNHEETIKAITDKKVDAGGVDSIIFQLLVKKGTVKPDNFYIIKESDKLYEYPWATSKDLDQTIRKKLLAAFLGLKDPEILKSFGLSGFTAAEDQQYDNIRQAAKDLHINLTSFTVPK